MLFYFIGNSDFLKHKKKHIFIEHMLDKNVFGVHEKDGTVLEDIESVFTKTVTKRVIFI